MTVMELGALGEFVGSIAVLATLIYLAVQIRQNTRSMDATRKSVIAESAREMNLAGSTWHLEIARDPELKRIAHKAMQCGIEEYNEEEWYEFRMIALSLMLQGQAVYAQRAMEVEYADQFNTWLRAIRSLVETFPTYRKFWDDAKSEGNLEPGFIEAIESVTEVSDMRKVLSGVVASPS